MKWSTGKMRIYKHKDEQLDVFVRDLKVDQLEKNIEEELKEQDITAKVLIDMFFDHLDYNCSIFIDEER